MRHAVADAVDRVVGLVLEALEYGDIVRDEVQVDGRDLAARIRRSVASPDAETPSYWPLAMSVTISSELLVGFT